MSIGSKIEMASKLQLDSPGIAIRIRSRPSFSADEVELLESGSIVDVFDEQCGEFYKLVDGRGYVIVADDGISWRNISYYNHIEESSICPIAPASSGHCPHHLSQVKGIGSDVDENPAQMPLLSPAEKLEQVWNMLLQKAETQVILPNEASLNWPGLMTVGNSVRTADYNFILAHKEDTSEQEKLLCTNGFLCKTRIRWLPGHDFSGLYKQCDHGIMRLSSAVKPVAGSLPWFAGNIAKSKLFPCVAIKFFRQSSHSGNLLFGSRKTGQEEDLFFKYSLGTNISESTPFTLNWIVDSFRKFSAYPTQLGTSDFALIEEDGTVDEAPNFPWCLALRPRESLATTTFFQIQDIPADTVLYDIFAYATPSAAVGSKELVRIGYIETASTMIQSFSQDGIFFKHQLKEEDYAMRPDWLGQLMPYHAEVGPRVFDQQFACGNFRDV